MRITNNDNGKIMVEMEDGDVKGMENRVIDYVRQVVTQNVIKEITKQFLEDKEFIDAVKKTLKERIDNIRITDICAFMERKE
jgi:homospermidine synthase